MFKAFGGETPEEWEKMRKFLSALIQEKQGKADEEEAKLHTKLTRQKT